MRFLGVRRSAHQCVLCYRMTENIDRRIATVAICALLNDKAVVPTAFTILSTFFDGYMACEHEQHFMPEEMGKFAKELHYRGGNAAFAQFTYWGKPYGFGFVFIDREARLVCPSSASFQEICALRHVVESTLICKVEHFY